MNLSSSYKLRMNKENRKIAGCVSNKIQTIKYYFYLLTWNRNILKKEKKKKTKNWNQEQGNQEQGTTIKSNKNNFQEILDERNTIAPNIFYTCEQDSLHFDWV